MGTIYSVACRDCRVVRNLDKFYTLREAKSRAEALEMRKDIEKDSFRAALLVSFMWEHSGHNCTVFNEHSELEGTLGEYADGMRGEDFWRDAEESNASDHRADAQGESK